MDLEELEFSKSEARVYTALLNNGPSKLSAIQSVSGVERRYLYDVLNKLSDKGLISSIQENKSKIYKITHPGKILQNLEEKQIKLEKQQEKFKQELPEMIARFTTKPKPIQAKVLRGKEGIKALGEELLEHKNIYFIGGNGGVEENMPFFWKHYNEKRIKKKIMWHDLIIEKNLMKSFKHLKDAKKKLAQNKFYKFKTLPEELASPHVIGIYGDNVVMTVWEPEIFSFVIQSKEVAQSYLNYFKFLWKIMK